MANEQKLTTMGQMRSLAEQQDARDDAQDAKIENHTHDATSVKFADGETFQQKYDSGKLTGQAGKSAYAYAQDGGYTGTEAEFSAKLAEDNATVESITTTQIKALFAT